MQATAITMGRALLGLYFFSWAHQDNRLRRYPRLHGAA